MSSFEPAYLQTYQSGQLQQKRDRAIEALAKCGLCPHACAVNRLKGETGVCRTGRRARLASFGPHFGEESPLVGQGGSGTIFLASCNLLCLFCQNDGISHERAGREVEPAALAEAMLSLQRRGCHNINFVTPTHCIAQLLEALVLAVEQGLCVPLVYNTGGYDAVQTLDLLHGVFDIYMPDLKFMDSESAAAYCNAPDYAQAATSAIVAMHRQVGDLRIEKGLARRGLLVRHLVLPNDLAGTRKAMRFLASLSTDTYVNTMSQYRPWCRSGLYPEIDRRPTAREFARAIEIALEEGITRLDRR